MAEINFNSIITNSGVTSARQTYESPGWYLKPKRWAVSSSYKELSAERIDMLDTWYESPFSGILAEDTNTLLHHIVFAPNIPIEKETRIGEIYFIYEDNFGNEFLYAIAQPSEGLEVYYTPGVAQSYYFSFTLNNIDVTSTFEINYTYPQDIEDHNNKIDVHTNLLKRDGSRTANGVLSYATDLEFINDFDIIDKKYADSIVNHLKNLIDTIYCPPGTMIWYPSITQGTKDNLAPDGWLVRNGAEYKKEDYPNLYKVIGDTYSKETTTRSGYFRVPDDRGLFIRGYDDGKGYDIDRIFGSYQEDGAPNINAYGFMWVTKGNADIENGPYLGGSLYFKDRNSAAKNGIARDVNNDNSSANGPLIGFDASRSSSKYQNGLDEVRVKNRAYLPIIKY